MIKELGGTKNVELSRKYYNDIYVMKDGRALIDFDSHAFLHPSVGNIENYFLAINSKYKNSKPQHILAERFPYKQDFVSKIGPLVKSISKEFLLPTDVPSLEQLKVIDKYLMDQPKATDFTKYFPGLIAYVGECLRLKLGNAHWKLQNSSLYSDIWEPLIVGNNNEYNPYLLVYKELYEEYVETGEISLHDHTEIELIQYEVKIKK